jgi:hypothetical protein
MTKRILILAALLSTTAQASTTTIIAQESKEIILQNPLQSPLGLECSTGFPGGHGHFPVEGGMFLTNVSTAVQLPMKYDSLIFKIGEFGIDCTRATGDFLKELPAKLTVTRTVSEECTVDNYGPRPGVIKVRSQAMSGVVGNYSLGGDYEFISRSVVEGGTCP